MPARSTWKGSPCEWLRLCVIAARMIKAPGRRPARAWLWATVGWRSWTSAPRGASPCTPPMADTCWYSMEKSTISRCYAVLWKRGAILSAAIPIRR